ncbi:MAG: DNA-binding transcriptional regulator CsiR [Gammaproteobacteria bacterium]|nr:DNA-binding transcriptional regulator CsiR [Gammaproteobacteria bacterium]
MSKANSAAKVMQRLKQDILAGHFEPGQKLKMAALKAHYGVGVNPLREALSQLIVEQLVIAEDQRGYRVHPVSQAEMLDIYDARAHLEALCVELAIVRGDDAWEAGIIAAAHRLQANAGLLMAGNMQDWEQLHQAFHLSIVAGCGSQQLLQARWALYEKASRYRNLWLRHNAGHAAFDVNQKEHEDLVQYLLQRDVVKATRLIKSHLLVPSQVLHIERKHYKMT